MCKFQFRLVHWIDPHSIEHSYACSWSSLEWKSTDTIVGISILLFQQMLDATKCVETWAEFPQSVVDDAINQWWKRQETCIHAGGGHFEHLLWRYLRDVRVGTQQNQFFSQPPVPHNTLPFRSHQHLEGNNMPSFIRMSSAFHKILTFFKCDGQVRFIPK